MGNLEVKKIKKYPIYKREDGYLYMPVSKINIQREYKPILEEISFFFKRLDNKNVQSVYLRGSLVWGWGIKNFSDLDLFIITSNLMTKLDKKIIKQFMDNLNKKYSFVTRVDMRYFTLRRIFSSKENVLIKLTGVCIYGDEIKKRIKNPRPGKDIAISISLLEEEIEKTKTEIEEGFYDKSNTKAMCLWIMKRMVRAGFEIVSKREGCFTRDLELCLEIFSKYYPSKRNSLKRAFELTMNPSENLELIKEVLDEIGGWLLFEGKRINLIPPSCKEVSKKATEEVKLLFNKNRIICFLRYGPKERFDKSPPRDLDFLLLLDKFKKEDYSKLFSIKKMNLPLEIFIDYKDQILSKGVKSYQRGRHGSYFFKILASAKTLIGENYYKKNENNLDKIRIKLDLLYRVEEYFYRIQKNLINTKFAKKSEIEKYLGRILTDLMLVKEEISFKEVHKYHYTHILNNKVDSTHIINNNTKNLIRKFLLENKVDMDLIGEIIGDLYKLYLNIEGVAKQWQK
jgi:uncharacterized protein